MPRLPNATSPLSRLLHLVAASRRLIGLAVKNRRLYASAVDNYKAFVLRLALTRRGRRILSPKLCRVSLRTPPVIVHLRRTTSDMLVAQEVFEFRVYQPVAEWTLPADPVIFDLGANIGLATLYFQSLFPGARVVAVEPDEGNRQLMELNCRALLERNQVSVVGAFIGAENGTAGINRGGDSWAFRKARAAEAITEEIECLSIPSLLRRTAVDRIDLLKCDIEGSEAEIFAECGQWIDRVHYMIVETHHPYSPQALYHDLSRAGWGFTVQHEAIEATVAKCFLEGPPERRRGD
jgi:FkbM family methyltransferase